MQQMQEIAQDHIQELGFKPPDSFEKQMEEIIDGM